MTVLRVSPRTGTIREAEPIQRKTPRTDARIAALIADLARPLADVGYDELLTTSTGPD